VHVSEDLPLDLTISDQEVEASNHTAAWIKEKVVSIGDDKRP